MRHKCRYVGSHSSLIRCIHTRKTISIYAIKCFCCFFIYFYLFLFIYNE